jgi:hypothetical protein
VYRSWQGGNSCPVDGSHDRGVNGAKEGNPHGHLVADQVLGGLHLGTPQDVANGQGIGREGSARLYDIARADAGMEGVT